MPRGRPQNPTPARRRSRSKESIPKAIREQVWLKYQGSAFEAKCTVTWCKNKINTFDFHVGHNVPESKGGTLDITNLRPICARCNLSMGANYTIAEWNKLGAPYTPSFIARFFSCFSKKSVQPHA
jgi:5-methylcytosine-specific restriction endonuclease McrA